MSAWFFGKRVSITVWIESVFFFTKNFVWRFFTIYLNIFNACQFLTIESLKITFAIKILSNNNNTLLKTAEVIVFFRIVSATLFSWPLLVINGSIISFCFLKTFKVESRAIRNLKSERGHKSFYGKRLSP